MFPARYELARWILYALIGIAIPIVFQLPTGIAAVCAGSIALAAPLYKHWRHRQQDSPLNPLLQTLIETIPEPVYIKDARSRYVMVNTAFAEHHGSTPAALVGQTPEEVFRDEAYGQTVRDEDARILAGESVLKEERGINPATGKERYLRVSKRAWRSGNGDEFIVGTNIDTTTWRIAERDLQEALTRATAQRERTQKFIQRLINVIPDPVYVKDASSRFTLVNRAFAAERGKAPEDLIGRSSAELAPSDEMRQTVAREDAEILAGAEVRKEQHTRHPISGVEVFRLVTKRPSTDADGNPVIVGAHFDLSKWRIAERNLSESLSREVALRERVQNFTQRLIDVIPQPVYVKSAVGRYVMVNEAFARERRMAARDILGLSAAELSEDEHHIQSVTEEDRSVLAGNIIFKEELKPHPISGEDRYRLISKRTCLDAEARPVIVGANFDITPWRNAEQRLSRAKEAAEQASAAKSLFLASMSHEIRTPLSGVIGTLRIALRDPRLPPETRDYMRSSLSNAESLLGIISDILDFSKIEAGQLKLENIDFDLHTTANDSLQPFRDHAESRDLHFELKIDERIPRYLRGDPTRLRQVLINLVGNAVKFTEHGTVAVNIEMASPVGEQARLQFSVEDSGIGIPADALARLFQKFQQADVSTTRRFGGTGLGLAICRQLVEAMGGTISAHSTVGVGSRFEFTLPLQPGVAVEHIEAAPLTPHSRALRVLCAEDVPVNQMIVRAQLSSMGHEVSIVGDGLAAIRALAEQDYDLVLMDGRMPEMDGADAARAIRNGGLPGIRVRNPAVRIVALTANASIEDRDQYLGAGMDDYLTKPVSERQLHNAISTTIALLDGQAPPSFPTQLSVPDAEENILESHTMRLFADSLPQHIAALDQGLSRRDLGGLEKLFQNINENAAALGLQDLQMLANDLEHAASAGKADVIEQGSQHLRGALHAILACMD